VFANVCSSNKTKSVLKEAKCRAEFQLAVQLANIAEFLKFKGSWYYDTVTVLYRCVLAESGQSSRKLA